MRKEHRGHFFNIELRNWGGFRGRSGIPLPAYMQENEIRLFLSALESFPFTERTASRNRLMIKLILFTGMRVGECLNLRPKDLVPEEDAVLIKVVGKGNKERVVMVREEYIDFEYRQLMHGRKGNGYLFDTERYRDVLGLMDHLVR